MLPPNERITPTIIVTIGRGGTGKTSFVALMAKCFIEEKETPLLLVDIDPDQSLAEMVGVDLEKAQKKTIAELLTETFLEVGGTTVGVSPTERIESKIWEKSLFEGDTFDLLAVGTKWVEGCYCLPDAALKNALGSIIKQYRYILIDSPAGLEHLCGLLGDRADLVSSLRQCAAGRNRGGLHSRNARRAVYQPPRAG